MSISSTHSNSILLTTLRCKLKVYISTHTNEKPSTTNWYFSQNWYGNESQKSERNLSYVYSFTPIQKLKSLVKTRTLNAGTSELIPKRNRMKFLTLHLLFCLLIRKKKHAYTPPPTPTSPPHKYSNLTTILSTLESTTLDKAIRSTSNFNFNTKNAKFRVGLSQVCNLRTTHSPVLKSSFVGVWGVGWGWMCVL